MLFVTLNNNIGLELEVFIFIFFQVYSNNAIISI